MTPRELGCQRPVGQGSNSNVARRCDEGEEEKIGIDGGGGHHVERGARTWTHTFPGLTLRGWVGRREG